MAAVGPWPSGRQVTFGRLGLRLWSWVWLSWWGGLATLGLLLGARTWSPSTIVGVAALSGSSAVACSLLQRSSRHPSTPLQIISVVGRRTLLTGVAVASLCLLVRVFGSIVWPMLALAAISSPPVVGRALGRERPPPRKQVRRDQPPSRQIEQPLPSMAASAWVSAVRMLSTEELCTSWRASYTIVRQATASDTRVDIVSFREACLDEMERRDPRGLHAWLGSGARAAGNPARFLSLGIGTRGGPG